MATAMHIKIYGIICLIFLVVFINSIEGQDVGTRENPIPIGERTTICDGWQLVVEKVYPSNGGNLSAMILLGCEDNRPLMDYHVNRLKVVDQFNHIYNSTASVRGSEIRLRINSSNNPELMMYDDYCTQSDRKYFSLYYYRDDDRIRTY